MIDFATSMLILFLASSIVAVVNFGYVQQAWNDSSIKPNVFRVTAFGFGLGLAICMVIFALVIIITS